MKVEVNYSNGRIWGLELISESKEEQYFLEKLDVEQPRVCGLTMGKSIEICLPSMAGLKVFMLDSEQRAQLAYAIGMAEVIGTAPLDLDELKATLFSKPRFVSPPLPKPAPTEKTVHKD